jgi:membrane associated rhomboid family serine protease
MEEKEKHFAYLTYVLIVLNVVVFFSMFSNLRVFSEIIEMYGLKPLLIFNGREFVRIFTYMFLHGDITHLFANLFSLWGIGTIVERDIGTTKFGLIYFVSGIFAGLGHSILHPGSNTPLVGASGAVFGVLAVLFLLMPFTINFVMFIPLPSVLVGLIMATIEVSALLYSGESYVAHDAHLAGFIIGGISAFTLDWERALKGLFIAVLVVFGIYLVSVYGNLL